MYHHSNSQIIHVKRGNVPTRQENRKPADLHCYNSLPNSNNTNAKSLIIKIKNNQKIYTVPKNVGLVSPVQQSLNCVSVSHGTFRIKVFTWTVAY